MPRPVNLCCGSVRVSAAVLALVACALLAAHGATGTNFGGSPIISYGQRFKIYSVSDDAFCRTDCAQRECIVFCDVAVSNATQATYFVLGGSCGRVVTSSLTRSSLYVFNGDSCASTPWSLHNPYNFRCNRPQCAPDAQRYNVMNVQPASDGWLRGNDTIIHMREAPEGGEALWCDGVNGNMWCLFTGSSYGFKFVVVG
ncbi:hypothetical protein psal_cds_497 [Pandoravirus salinus]|uniref:Uncharacterized protein n=1 Tax=Pandoravirus salinus TaxID=1349410 RepID=S4VV88_9VIRU|nr:hypothetical protein psal_cds_497 [Pandoravirus salinus]AGO84288.1 hypothetical protein psal_cds_497 [Pandoravirus salinus]